MFCQQSDAVRSQHQVCWFYYLAATPNPLSVFVGLWMCAVCSVEMADGKCRANLHHSCSAATTAPAAALQGNNTHIHSQVPVQHYYPLNLTCPLNSISLFIYSKWCVAPCLPTSLRLSHRFSLPADRPGGDWWELWWDEAGCAHVSLSYVPGPAVSWAHPSHSGSAGRGNVRTNTHLPAVSVPTPCAAQGVVRLKI